MRGHLFAGRDKSPIIDDGDPSYLRTTGPEGEEGNDDELAMDRGTAIDGLMDIRLESPPRRVGFPVAAKQDVKSKDRPRTDPVTTVSTAQDFVRVASSAKPGTIESLEIDGHGSPFQAGFHPDDPNSYEGLLQEMHGVAVIDASGNTIARVGVICAKKFAPNGKILLLSCQASAGNDNIAKDLSKQIPGVLVEGSQVCTGDFGKSAPPLDD